MRPLHRQRHCMMREAVLFHLFPPFSSVPIPSLRSACSRVRWAGLLVVDPPPMNAARPVLLDLYLTEAWILADWPLEADFACLVSLYGRSRAV
jgi:hypothetical protein